MFALSKSSWTVQPELVTRALLLFMKKTLFDNIEWLEFIFIVDSNFVLLEKLKINLI